MDETIYDLIEKKDEFQEKANELKEKRNKLHLKSKKLADDRDSLNSAIRSMRNKIFQHKKDRDELNERVQHAKEQRNKLNMNLSENKRKIRELERTRLAASGENLNELRRQLKTFENEQMTKPMSPRKEKKVIEIISELHSKIKKQEELLNKDPKLKKAIEEEKNIRQKAEKQHDIVEKLALRAQEEHEAMIRLIRQLDNSVRKVNETQEMIVNTKIQADEVHKEFISYVDKIHDLERDLSAAHDDKRKKRKTEEATTAHKEANEIFEKFKRGEKLSTEDLLTLQKAGLI
jgi:uncharacterized coiled-coil DUF342 family protein